MTNHRATDNWPGGSLPPPIVRSDENPSSGTGRARSPPGGVLEYVIEPHGTKLGMPRYTLMVHAENVARTIGTHLFGKW